MSGFDPNHYGPALADMLDTDRSRELGPGQADRSMQARLQDLSVKSVGAGKSIVDGDMARLCLSGLWLLHGFLDRSHTISQSVQTASGSYWHGIMHRREPDFSNAKYWFRKTGHHPIQDPLGEIALTLARHDESTAAAAVRAARSWDPLSFVDLCETAETQDDDASRAYCGRLSQREWELLFDYCWRRAVGEKCPLT